jgi:peptidoglycan/xylan/chitin deacetylase (PgdA/CDA1 family)
MDFRWALKRGAKWATEWSMALSGGGIIYRNSPHFCRGGRILTYHGVADEARDSYSVASEHFRFHMAYISDHFKVVSLGELVRSLKTGAGLDGSTVAVTFDDGYKECGGFVAEILQRYRIPATFFVVTDILDGKINSNKEFLSWDDTKSMAGSGFYFGSHTVSHRSLGELPISEVTQELAISKKRIQEELGVAPDGLAYPFGTLRDFSPDVAAIAREAGYAYAATAIHGLNHQGCDPFLLQRTTLGAGDGPRTFRMIMKGYLDPWHLVDKWGYKLQRPNSSGLG